jgi:tetratricopeptide (TPR) repeat protein
LDALGDDPAAAELRIVPLGEKARALVAEDRYEEAQRTFAALFDLVHDPDELLEHRQIASRILRERAYELAPVQRELSDEVFALSLDLLDDDPVTRKPALLCEGLVRRLEVLNQLGKGHEAQALTERILRRYSEAEDPNLQELVGYALQYRAKRRSIQRRHELALADYEELIRKFSDAKTPALWVVFHDALEGYTNELIIVQDYSAAVKASDELVAFLDTHDMDGRKESLAGALYRKAWALHQLGDDGEARVIADSIVSRYETSQDPKLEFVVERTKTLLEDLSYGSARLVGSRGRIRGLAVDQPTSSPDRSLSIGVRFIARCKRAWHRL